MHEPAAATAVYVNAFQFEGLAGRRQQAQGLLPVYCHSRIRTRDNATTQSGGRQPATATGFVTSTSPASSPIRCPVQGLGTRRPVNGILHKALVILVSVGYVVMPSLDVGNGAVAIPFHPANQV